MTCDEDLETPSNGNINCSSNNQPLQYEDTCRFQCNDGYEVQGSVMRQCEASGEWSGSGVTCSPGKVATNAHSYTITVPLQYHVSVSMIQRMVM